MVVGLSSLVEPATANGLNQSTAVPEAASIGHDGRGWLTTVNGSSLCQTLTPPASN